MSEIKIIAEGPVGSGKSAVLGEIEILCKALGIPVRYANPADAASEKSMTHADWISYLDLYKPSVVLYEQSPSSQARAYCEPCQAAGMSNCSEFDVCGQPKCILCHRTLD